MKNGIVILGNGFDLFHGHKTSYSDFIENVSKKLKNNIWINYFLAKQNITGWVDIENEFKLIIDDYIEFQNEHRRYYSIFPVDVKYLTLFDFLRLECRNHSVGEKTYFDKIIAFDLVYKDFFDDNLLNYSVVSKRIINDFIEVKNNLASYIGEKVSKNSNYSSKNSIYNELSTYDNLIIINFNYTNTLDFYNENLKNIFVHGDVENTIVLGHNNILHPEFSLLNKQNQQHSLGLNYKYNFIDFFNALPESDEFNLITLGHSFDENDHPIFTWVYNYIYTNGSSIDNLINFYYKNNHNTDFINRTHNLRTFYSKSLDIICKNPATGAGMYVGDYFNRFIETRIGENYCGYHEYDYFERKNLIKNIELK